jgi:hypothetical protein
MTSSDTAAECAPAPSTRVALRNPAEMADALPYLLGFHPDDSVVVVALHGEEGQFGGRVRVALPDDPTDWPDVASQVAAVLERGAVSRGERPDGAVVFLCQEPAPPRDASGQAVAARLRPLAQLLRTACGEREMPVYEALCVSHGKYWSYCCPDPACCPPEGRALPPHGTSPMAAAATYAGIRVRGSLRDMEARLRPVGAPLAGEQEDALDRAAAELVPKMLSEGGDEAVRRETLTLARGLLDRFGAVPVRTSASPDGDAESDAADDRALGATEAATVILGLQDRQTRDRAAEWMEGDDAAPALRLWRALARRCTGLYREHAAAPLSLAGWVAWSGGDEIEARVAFGRALESDPQYLFARLMHRACNEGLDPEPLRRFMRGAPPEGGPAPSGTAHDGAPSPRPHDGSPPGGGATA